MVYKTYACNVQLHYNRKSISSGDIFPKIIWEAQSGQNRGVRVRIWGWRADSWGWGSIPGDVVDFWLDPGIWADYSILAWICDISAFFDLNGFSVILAGLKSSPKSGPEPSILAALRFPNNFWKNVSARDAFPFLVYVRRLPHL